MTQDTSRERVTTTHDPAHGGDPRLVVAPSEHPWPGDRRGVHHLTAEVTTIGSAEDCDIVVPDLEDYVAQVRHDRDDEYVVVRLGAPGTVRVTGEAVAARILRTGSRLTVGARDDATLTFAREEYADHGRPFGGRAGGEIGHQRPQPPRPGGDAHDRKAAWETP
ncbi:MAG: FHA domain-containing protein [Nocardioides sp.]